MARKAKEVLERARDLLGDRQRWTQNGLAVDRQGHPCDPLGQEAYSYSLGGALHYAGNFDPDWLTEEWFQETALAMATLQTLAGSTLEDYNDTHTYEEVLGLLDRAIKQL